MNQSNNKSRLMVLSIITLILTLIGHFLLGERIIWSNSTSSEPRYIWIKIIPGILGTD